MHITLGVFIILTLILFGVVAFRHLLLEVIGANAFSDGDDEPGSPEEKDPHEDEDPEGSELPTPLKEWRRKHERSQPPFMRCPNPTGSDHSYPATMQHLAA